MTSDNRLIVVRAWQDTDRLVIRLIVSVGPGRPAVESVFSDIQSATDRLTEVLSELCDHPLRRLREQPAESNTER